MDVSPKQSAELMVPLDFSLQCVMPVNLQILLVCCYNLWLKAEISADMNRLWKGEVKEEREGRWRESKIR